MSTGSVNLDILLDAIKKDYISGQTDSLGMIKERFPGMGEKESYEIFNLVKGALSENNDNKVELITTAPPSFSLKSKLTKTTVEDMIKKANSCILMTGYSISDYFSELMETIIDKSKKGVFIKIFINNISTQGGNTEKLLRYKGKFLKIYNYSSDTDRMAALHAKVISVDQEKTLITSANLSYHGQQGNIEMGTLVESKEYAGKVDDFFTQMIFKKIFIEV